MDGAGPGGGVDDGPLPRPGWEVIGYLSSWAAPESSAVIWAVVELTILASVGSSRAREGCVRLVHNVHLQRYRYGYGWPGSGETRLQGMPARDLGPGAWSSASGPPTLQRGRRRLPSAPVGSAVAATGGRFWRRGRWRPAEAWPTALGPGRVVMTRELGVIYPNGSGRAGWVAGGRRARAGSYSSSWRVRWAQRGGVGCGAGCRRHAGWHGRTVVSSWAPVRRTVVWRYGADGRVGHSRTSWSRLRGMARSDIIGHGGVP